MRRAGFVTAGRREVTNVVTSGVVRWKCSRWDMARTPRNFLIPPESPSRPLSMRGWSVDCSLAFRTAHTTPPEFSRGLPPTNKNRVSVRLGGCTASLQSLLGPENPELGAPAGGIRLPFARENRGPRRTGRVKGGGAGEWNERTLDASEHRGTLASRWAACRPRPGHRLPHEEPEFRPSPRRLAIAAHPPNLS